MGLFNWFGDNKPEFGVDDLGELKLKKYFLSLLRNKDGVSVLEAGASGGEDTVQWASLPGVQNVYAFEPVSVSFNALTKQVAGLKNVHCYNLGLSNERGEAIINVSENTNNPNALPSSSSVLRPTGHIDFHKHIQFNRSEKIKLVTIDEWALENKVDSIDVMWLDMQGFECTALRGASRMMEHTQLIYSEVSLKSMYADSLLYPEFKSFMHSKGFKVEAEFLFWDDMGNVLFKKQK